MDKIEQVSLIDAPDQHPAYDARVLAFGVIVQQQRQLEVAQTVNDAVENPVHPQRLVDH